MEEKVLSEIEHKEYLLKIAEEKIVKLEDTIRKYESFLAVSLYLIIPLALTGLIFITEEISVEMLVFMVLSVIIFIGVILSLGWLVEKFKNN